MRVIDESLWLRPSAEKIIDYKTWLYSLDESEFMSWVDKESLNIHKNTFQYFILITGEDIIEVISIGSPVITSI